MTRIAVALAVGAAWWGSAGHGGEPADPFAGRAPVSVAASLLGKRGGREVHRLARVFDGPRGDGRLGAKGVVVCSGILWEKTGTRWAFRYRRSKAAYGVQVIHPYKKGQVVIRITRTGVAMATPRAWAEIGYHSGGSKRLTRTEYFPKVFPLKETELTDFVSTLRPDGSYELEAKGEVVARGRFTEASAISFELKEGQTFPGASGWGKLEFKGHQFPEQWEPGYGGILLEPLDSGENTVIGLTFLPSLPRSAEDGRGQRLLRLSSASLWCARRVPLILVPMLCDARVARRRDARDDAPASLGGVSACIRPPRRGMGIAAPTLEHRDE